VDTVLENFLGLLNGLLGYKTNLKDLIEGFGQNLKIKITGNLDSELY